MKNILNTSTQEIKRLDDRKAETLVSASNSPWKYVPKKEWKEKVRDVKKNEPKNEKMIQINLTEEEILKNPNDSDLGGYIRKKYFDKKTNMEQINSKLLEKKNLDKVLAKLRQPCHIDFISSLLKVDNTQTLMVINYLVENDLIVESPSYPGYYSTVKNYKK